MGAVPSSDSSAEEFELDLTGEHPVAPSASEQRHEGRQDGSSSLVGTIEYRDRKVAIRIDDLSAGGAGVNLESRLPLNEECKLTIQLSVCGSDYELTMKSRVRYCDVLIDRSFHAGLQFIDMDQATRDTLLLLIR